MRTSEFRMDYPPAPVESPVVKSQSRGTSAPTHFQNLQALRGVACLLVVIYHTATQEELFGLSFQVLRPVHWFGYAGVDLFFVLSGFIITMIGRKDLGRPE